MFKYKLIVYIVKLIVYIKKMKSNNEEKAILKILQSPENEYNANSISKLIKVSSMGALKLLKRLEKEGILKQRKVSNISFYKINFENSYAVDYVSLMIKSKAEHCTSYVKRWVGELRKIRNAEIGIIFGSILSKGEKANDIDVLFVVEKKKFNDLKKEVEYLNILNEKKIHPVFQTREDLAKNIEKKDKVVLEAIKGIVAFGEKEFVKLIGGTK